MWFSFLFEFLSGRPRNLQQRNLRLINIAGSTLCVNDTDRFFCKQNSWYCHPKKCKIPEKCSYKIQPKKLAGSCAQPKRAGNWRQETGDENEKAKCMMATTIKFFLSMSEREWKNKTGACLCLPQKKIPNQLFDAVIKTLLFFSSATHSEKALLQKFIEPTLELVEEAWHGEVTSTKRNRGWYDRSMDWQAVCVCATLDNF